VLDNGLESRREDRSAPLVALSFFVRVGSLSEDEAIADWSHGISTCYSGTPRPGDIARRSRRRRRHQRRHGAGCYYITLPAENIETAAIFTDVLMHSTFDASSWKGAV
jgi:predicted Zn-dependent peptidase